MAAMMLFDAEKCHCLAGKHEVSAGLCSSACHFLILVHLYLLMTVSIVTADLTVG